MSNIIGDPFALATVSIAGVSLQTNSLSSLPASIFTMSSANCKCSDQLAWVISFIGSIIARVQETKRDPFPPYSWFALVFMLPLIIGITIVVASDCIQTYHVALVGYLACGLIATTSSVNALVYDANAAREAAAAGFILLSMVNVS